MALLTPLGFPEAKTLLQAYGRTLKKLTPLAAGSVNSNFLLEVDSDCGLFARIYEEQGESGALFELQLNGVLNRAGLPVAAPVERSDGQLVSWVGTKPFGVYEQVAGHVLEQHQVTPKAAFSVGVQLARVHRANLGKLSIPSGRFGKKELYARLEQVERAVELEPRRTELARGVKQVREIMKGVYAQQSSELPRGLIHGDLFRDNVLMHDVGNGACDEVAALLDFESASEGVFVYDLMVSLLAWCFNDHFDLALVRSMVQGYQTVRSLSSLERKQMAVEGARACARFATTRMTDFSLRTSVNQPPERDFQRFFKRLASLEAGALDQALSGMF